MIYIFMLFLFKCNPAFDDFSLSGFAYFKLLNVDLKHFNQKNCFMKLVKLF